MPANASMQAPGSEAVIQAAGCVLLPQHIPPPRLRAFDTPLLPVAPQPGRPADTHERQAPLSADLHCRPVCASPCCRLTNVHDAWLCLPYPRPSPCTLAAGTGHGPSAACHDAWKVHDHIVDVIANQDHAIKQPHTCKHAICENPVCNISHIVLHGAHACMQVHMVCDLQVQITSGLVIPVTSAQRDPRHICATSMLQSRCPSHEDEGHHAILSQQARAAPAEGAALRKSPVIGEGAGVGRLT